MPAAGEIRWVRAADGAHLAYHTLGDGPIDLLEIGGHGALFSLEAADEQPRWRAFEEGLARFARLIRFDLRGIGSSERGDAAPTVDDWVNDALAVMGAVGCDRASVFGSSFGALAAIRLAARHPQRVRSLVLASAFARVLRAADYRIGLPAERVAEAAGAVDPDLAGDDSDIGVMAPSLADDPDIRRWWARAARRGAGPAAAAAVWAIVRDTDVRDDLPRVQVPALVLHAVDNPFLPAVFGRWLARELPDGRFVGLPGADHVIWADGGERALAEIEEFLTGRRVTAAGRRGLTAIVFTDIVDSTARNAAAGDASWVERLGRHDRMVQDEIDRYGGRRVKGTGDGVLAVFPLPSTALAAARAIVDAAGGIGVEVRAAVHAAEIAWREDDVAGLGVTVAARILGHAAGGQVVTTGTVAELLAGSALKFEAAGRHQLRGVPGQWELYRLAPAD